MKTMRLLVFLAVTASCSLVDFSPAEDIMSNPSSENQILSESEKIQISFSFEPERNSAESLFSVRDYSGDIDGDIRWEGKKLFFNPSEKLVRGRRYTLCFSGNVEKKDGGSARVELLIPFFYISDNASVPYITGINPHPGSVMDREGAVTVSFSRSIDTGSFKKGFSISPDREHTLIWEESDSRVVITPREKWENLTSYCFSFSTDICCLDAIPLEEEYRFTVYVDSSHVNPFIVSTETAMRDIASSFPPLSPDLNSIKYNDALRIVFSEDMNTEKAGAAFSIDPYTAGRKLWIDNSTLIFLPDKFWKWEELYRITINTSAESGNGIKLAEEYLEEFAPDINGLFLSTLDGKAGDGFPVNSFSESSYIEIETDPVAPYTYTFTLTFSEIFASNAEKVNAQDSLNISCIFPPNGISPFPVMYSWLSDTALTVKYSGFTPYDSAGNIYYYYLLKIKGGEAGIINSSGSYLSGDIKQLLRTK